MAHAHLGPVGVPDRDRLWHDNAVMAFFKAFCCTWDAGGRPLRPVTRRSPLDDNQRQPVSLSVKDKSGVVAPVNRGWQILIQDP